MKPKLILIVCFVLQWFVSFSETEPNNTAAQANILLYNGTQSGSVSDTDGADWYILRVPQGSILTLMLNSNGGHETTVYLKDSTQVNTDLAYGGFYFGDKTKDSIVAPLLKGTYYVAVIRSRGSGTYSIGSSLKILQWNEDVEPDNEAAKALTLPVNGSVTGLIGHYDPRVKTYDPADWYKITIPQGGNLKLQFYSDGGPESYFYLSDSSQVGTSLSNAGFYFRDRTRDSISFPVLKGTYFLQCLKSRGSGAYKIESKLQILKWSEDKEFNNDGAMALSLPVNGSLTGLIGHYDPRVKNYDPDDWYKITVPQGGNLRLQFYSDGGSEANFYLSDSSQVGASLSNAGFYFRDKTRDSISFPVLKGTYFLRFLRNRGSGAYKIESSLKVPIWSEDIEPNNNQQNALKFPLNTSLSGLINYYNPSIKNFDTEDWYKIKSEKAGYLVINLSSDSLVEASIYLKDSLNIGSSISSASFSFSDRTKDSLVARIKAGTYYMVVYRSRGSGRYRATSKQILSPDAEFTISRTDNFVSFENKTIGERATFLWKFDDNTTATTINASKEYKVPKNYNVCLIATNPAGVDTVCKTVIIPGIDRVLPTQGGNTGDVTIEVFGGGLDTNYVGKIMKDNTIVATSNFTGIAGVSSVSLRFDLRNKPVGTYDFFVEKKGGSPSYKLTGGFRIVTGTKPNVWANIIGRNRILFNTSTTYTLNYGNSGNTDARVAPIWLVISHDPSLEVKFPETVVIDSDTIVLAQSIEDDLYEIVDSLFGKPGKWRAYPMLFPLVEAGSNHSMKIKIKTSSDLKIHTWTEKPWFKSPLNEGKLGCINNAIDTVVADISSEFMRCVKEFTVWRFLNLNKNFILEDWISVGVKNPTAINILNYDCKKAVLFCEINAGLKLSESTRKGIRVQVITELLTMMWLKSPNKPKPAPSIKSQHIIERSISGCDTTEIEPQNPASSLITAVSSLDPNEKTGPSGIGPNNYLKASTGFPYTIYFENKSTATAPAHQIAITDKLDPAVFDLKSFSFGKVTIGDSTIFVPSGLRAFTLDKKLKYLNVVARVTGKLDTITGAIEWLFRSLDPKTLDDVEDPDIGILPPNKKSPSGEGNVNYFVKLKNEPRHNQQIKNKASIVFDANPAIITNEYIVTFDLVAPQSSVHLIKPITGTRQFTVNWSGNDDGSGVQSYDVYVKSGTEPYKIWLSGTTATSAIFSSPIDGVYQFSSVAVDKTGNSELLPATPDASTNVITGLEERVLPESEVKVIQMPNSDNLILNIGMPGQFTFRVFGVDGKLKTQQEVYGNSISTIKASNLPEGMYIWQLMDVKTNKINTGKFFIHF